VIGASKSNQVEPAHLQQGDEGVTAKSLNAPLTLSILWLAGTYAAFLVVGQTSRVPDLWKLSAYVASTVAAFAIGYRLKARRYVNAEPPANEEVTPQRAKSVRRWVLISAVYLALFGIALLGVYGATGLESVLSAIQSPGTAYFLRLRDTSATITGTNRFVQVLTLAAVLTTPLVPLVILYWKHLTIATRLAAAVGASLYCSYWLFIGTLKGLGDFMIFGVAAIMVVLNSRDRSPKTKRRIRLALIALVVLFAGYMVFNQADRLTSQDTTAGFTTNPVIESMVGEKIARGISVSAFYPTHGYLGLAYNLDTPFVWAGGRGSSQALDSYLQQYLDVKSVFPQTYPARTEARTGWPAGQYWATIYPWLASDLTFPGAVVFMGFVGWWLARFWYEAAFLRSRLSLLMFCQLMLLIAYVPANNQIGLMRPGLIAFVTLAAGYAVRRLHLFLLARRGASISARVSSLAHPRAEQPARGTPRLHDRVLDEHLPPTMIVAHDRDNAVPGQDEQKRRRIVGSVDRGLGHARGPD
jgi:hypothetical protein